MQIQTPEIMRIQVFAALILSLCMTLQVQAESQIERLDKAISQREHFIQIKQQRIDNLRHTVSKASTSADRLATYNRLYKEYLSYNFDSTMMYVDKAEAVVANSSSYDEIAQVKIHRALTLATSGHFSHAMSILDRIDSKRLSIPIREEYFAACEWTYGVWAEYSDKRTIAPEFTAKSLLYLDSLISVTDKTSPEYSYRIAEKSLRAKNYEDAERNYLVTLGKVPVDSRIYAQAAYALALTYKELGDKGKYKEWLINAAISDQMTPLKENLALQQLALFFKNEEGDLLRANDYLKIALDDAIFYNNRLRMLEIAEKIPDIANVYEDTIENNNRQLKLFILLIGILSIFLSIAVIYVYRQRRKVSKSNDKLEKLNEKLNELNQRLGQTNKTREQYVSLFMDLCAAYIEKLNRFPTILKLKVRQLSDVSSVADRYVRPSEAETKEMFFNFDSAFLRLYPDFINQFNSLLQEDKRIFPKKGELLNTDLRIYALVRMGISDSNKIASLLFLSSQTIFNHRTQVRNRAIDRENLERDILNICSTIPSIEQ